MHNAACAVRRADRVASRYSQFSVPIQIETRGATRAAR